MGNYSALAVAYDELTKNVNYKRRAKFIDKSFKKNNVAGIVLDAGCGTGTLALLLAKRGYDMIGVDASEDMLSIAAAKAAASRKDITLLKQELQALDLYGTVRGAVCMQDTLNHFGTGLAEVVGKFSLFIETGGVLVFDINTPYKHEKILAGNTFVYEFSRGTCVWQNEYLPDEKRVKLTVEICSDIGGGKMRRHTDVFYEYTIEPKHIEDLLERNDFAVISRLDGETYKEIKPESERILYVARKEKHTV